MRCSSASIKVKKAGGLLHRFNSTFAQITEITCGPRDRTSGDRSGSSCTPLVQGLFQLLKVVDVFASAIPAYDLAGWPIARRSTSAQPFPVAVHRLDPMHNIYRPSCFQRLFQRLHRRSPLFRVKRLQPSQVARLFTTHSGYLHPSGTDIPQVSIRIKSPWDLRAEFQHAPTVLFGLTEHVLRPLASRNVHDCDRNTNH